ncbi:MAG TPA: hypothetical protein VFV67_12270 [Actinophytocola sp.]|uniref:hypothetical protein n=1 Tax=Actinophytocola sp. TaxID=1872138 RepID=UPI002DBDA5BD|nr:hypothetical protein [Actinophytocola sp.]HEU5471421.1 hypothetical protein [Actinophytocola sp.]
MTAQHDLAVHRTIAVIDMAGFGDRIRTNRHQVAARAGMYRALGHAFDQARIPWAGCYHEDRGDGAFVLAPADIPKALFVERLPGALATALRRHNHTHPVEEQVRLRMAIHAGELYHDDYGVTGRALTLAFRLVSSPHLKQALATSPGSLALITSSWFFDEVVRNSHPTTAAYRPVPITVKESTTVGWISLPDEAEYTRTAI